MFNLQPGTGVGFSSSREIALGLGGIDISAPPEPFTPEPVHPPGMHPDADLRRRIQEEDEMLMAIIMAFLNIKDR